MQGLLIIVLYSFLEGKEDIGFEANTWELTEHQTKCICDLSRCKLKAGESKENSLGFQSRKPSPH